MKSPSIPADHQAWIGYACTSPLFDSCPIQKLHVNRQASHVFCMQERCRWSAEHFMYPAANLHWIITASLYPLAVLPLAGDAASLCAGFPDCAVSDLVSTVAAALTRTTRWRFCVIDVFVSTACLLDKLLAERCCSCESIFTRIQ